MEAELDLNDYHGALLFAPECGAMLEVEGFLGKPVPEVVQVGTEHLRVCGGQWAMSLRLDSTSRICRHSQRQ